MRKLLIAFALLAMPAAALAGSFSAPVQNPTVMRPIAKAEFDELSNDTLGKINPKLHAVPQPSKAVRDAIAQDYSMLNGVYLSDAKSAQEKGNREVFDISAANARAATSRICSKLGC